VVVRRRKAGRGGRNRSRSSSSRGSRGKRGRMGEEPVGGMLAVSRGRQKR
jgi:hypothetical protein